MIITLIIVIIISVLFTVFKSLIAQIITVIATLFFTGIIVWSAIILTIKIEIDIALCLITFPPVLLQ